MQLSFKLVLYALIFTGMAQAEVGYSSRPVIDTVTAAPIQVNQFPIPNWVEAKKAFAAYTADLLALSPNSHYFFLARDTEYLHDTARMLLAQDMPAQNRVHLLAISRPNLGDALTSQFLDQEGLNTNNLGNDNAVFIDLGWRGSIPNALVQKLPPGVAKKTVVQQVTSVSGNGIPSSRVFLQQLINSPNINLQQPDTHHSSVVQVEHLPHWTQRATGFQQVDGKIEAFSPGLEDSARALLLMQDVKAFAEDTAIKRWFETIREDMTIIAEAARGEKQVPAQELSDRFQRLKENGINHFQHDLLETANLNYLKMGLGAGQVNNVYTASSTPGDSRRLTSKPAREEKPTKINELTSGHLIQGTRLRIGGSEYRVVEKYPHKKEGVTAWYTVEDSSDGKRKLLTLPTIGAKLYLDQGNEDVKKEFDRAKERKKHLKSVGQNYLDVSIGQGYILTDLPSKFETGRDWYKKFQNSGALENKVALKLAQLLESLATNGIYLGELTRDNLIYDGSDWFIIDSGSVSKSDPNKALKRYIEKFDSRWGSDLVATFGSLSNPCARILKEIHDGQ